MRRCVAGRFNCLNKNVIWKEFPGNGFNILVKGGRRLKGWGGQFQNWTTAYDYGYFFSKSKRL